MNRDDIIRIARASGLVGLEQGGILENFQRFAALVAAEKDKEIARLREENIYLKEVYEDLVEDRKELFDDLDKAVAAEREKVAAWMRSKSYATGHGDTIEDLLKELEWQVAEESAELLQALQNLHQRCHWSDAPEEMDAAKAAIEKAIWARGEV